jgi:hypothetical protein
MENVNKFEICCTLPSWATAAQVREIDKIMTWAAKDAIAVLAARPPPRSR